MLRWRRSWLTRFRANVFYQKGAVAGAYRTIPYEIKTFKELGVPEIAERAGVLPRPEV